ncbi:hypothetical protein LUZ60_012406 [Juncus effusus]|nr:hypothetical protein LUZ60_012406 [Juncus effusus]
MKKGTASSSSGKDQNDLNCDENPNADPTIYANLKTNLDENPTIGSVCCPNCNHNFAPPTTLLVNIIKEWVGQLGGMKFEPSDQQLLEHLAAKVNKSGDLEPNPLIDEFITTIEGDGGICYTQPELLPGVTTDGLSKHFFHKPSKAYNTGDRKRRKVENKKVQIENRIEPERSETRWHKTGKTRPINVNGVHKGCKKILVLYTNFKKNEKPNKTNWVMHQYHLGSLEDEKEGELVVSKVFYQTQPRQTVNHIGNTPRQTVNAVNIGNSVNSRIDEDHGRNDSYQHTQYVDYRDEVPTAQRSTHGDGYSHEPSGYIANHVNFEQPSPAVSHLSSFHLSAPNEFISPIIVPPGPCQPVVADAYGGDMLPTGTVQSLVQQQQQPPPQQQQQQQQFHGNIANTSFQDMIMRCAPAGSNGEPSHAQNLQQASEWPFAFWPTTKGVDGQNQ